MWRSGGALLVPVECVRHVFKVTGWTIQVSEQVHRGTAAVLMLIIFTFRLREQGGNEHGGVISFIGTGSHGLGRTLGKRLGRRPNAAGDLGEVIPVPATLLVAERISTEPGRCWAPSLVDRRRVGGARRRVGGARRRVGGARWGVGGARWGVGGARWGVGGNRWGVRGVAAGLPVYLSVGPLLNPGTSSLLS